MRFPSNRSPRGIASLAGLLWLGSCGSTPPSSYYVLNGSEVGESGSSTNTFGIDIFSVDVAEYLDRPQIVASNGTNRLDVHEFERWGEPLDQGIRRVMGESLETRFASRGGRIVMREANDLARFQISVRIHSLDGKLGETLALRASWAIRDAVRQADDTHRRAAGRTVVSESASGDNPYEAWAAATSRAVAQLADEIGTALEGLTRSSEGG